MLGRRVGVSVPWQHRKARPLEGECKRAPYCMRQPLDGSFRPGLAERRNGQSYASIHGQDGAPRVPLRLVMTA